LTKTNGGQSSHEGRALLLLLLRCTTAAAAAAAAQLPLPLHVLNIVTFTCNNAQRSNSAAQKVELR
jgi:hypothetical protein